MKVNMSDEKRHVFTLNPNANGGEQILLTTTIDLNDGDTSGPVITQELELNSYGNMAAIHIGDAPFTPAMLRELANELESFLNNAKSGTG